MAFQITARWACFTLFVDRSPVGIERWFVTVSLDAPAEILLPIDEWKYDWGEYSRAIAMYLLDFIRDDFRANCLPSN